MLMENNPRYFDVCWAAQRSGLYYTTINRHLVPTRHTTFSTTAAPRCSSPRPGWPSRGGSARAAAGRARVAGEAELPRLRALRGRTGGASAGPPPDESEGREMLYSSGTTGRPRGCATRSRHAFGDPRQRRRRSPGLERARLRPDSGVPVPGAALPRRAAGLLHGHAPARRDGGRDGAASTRAVPRADRALPGHPGPVRADDVRPHAAAASGGTGALRPVEPPVAVHAAAPCPVEVKRQMLDWWGPIIYEYYAGTEDIGNTCITPEDWLAHQGSVGRPMTDATSSAMTATSCRRARPARSTSRAAGRSSTTTTRARPPHHQRQGLADPRRRRLPGRGRLPVPHRPQGQHDHLRRSEHLPAGGRERPRRPSRRLPTWPSSGCPTTRWARRSRPWCSCVDPAAAGPELEAELLAYCRAQLATYKCPRSVDFADELPRDANGKLYKRLLATATGRATTHG